MPDTIRAISLNCWGLKYISDHRHARLSRIGAVLAAARPPPDIVGLQECWTQQDFEAIARQTRDVLPHAKFYHSGVFGGGLAILSRWPIVESAMVRYALNGRPTAFFRGDWYVGKGVACATVRMDDGELLDVFCTHLHAPYEREPNDSYLCHRTSQAWQVAQLLRGSRAKRRLALALGDFNMLPLSLAHRLIAAHGPAVDAWRALHPRSSVGAAIDAVERARGLPVPTARDSVLENGATCDGVLNTWRWSKEDYKALKKGRDVVVNMDAEDPRAKRLDYIFVGGAFEGWRVGEAKVGMMERHPTLKVSLSDHFSVEATIERIKGASDQAEGLTAAEEYLPTETYDAILSMTEEYTQRERSQRRFRLWHFVAQLVISIGCLVAVWWSPHNYVSFLLMLLASLGLAAGVVDGLIGGLFMSWEIRCLKEFKWDMENVRRLSAEAVSKR